MNLLRIGGLWTLGAEGLTPEDLATPTPEDLSTEPVTRNARCSHTNKLTGLQILEATCQSRKDDDGNSNSGHSKKAVDYKHKEISTSLPTGATLIAEDEKVYIYELNGAIIVQQKAVKVRKTKRPVLARAGKSKRADIRKEEMTVAVREKPVTIMVPEIYRGDPLNYLKSLAPKDRKVRAVVKAAIKLLSLLPAKATATAAETEMGTVEA